MKLSFKHSADVISLESTNIYAENGDAILKVKGKFSFGETFIFFDASGNELGSIKGCTPSVLSYIWTKFDLYIGNTYIGSIKKNPPFSKSKFTIDYNNWQIKGNVDDEFSIVTPQGAPVAEISHKPLLCYQDEYIIDFHDIDNLLPALMIIYAIHTVMDKEPAGGG